MPMTINRSYLITCLRDKLAELSPRWVRIPELAKQIALETGNISNRKHCASILKVMGELGTVDLSGNKVRFKKPSNMSDEGRQRMRDLEEALRIADKRRKREIEEVAIRATEECRSVVAKLTERAVSAEKAAKEAEGSVRVVKVKQGNKIVRKMEELFHAKFSMILKLAEARMNIFLYGPTGCGKSHICEQIARALDLPFYFVSCTSGMSEGVLGGRLLPTGSQGTFEYTVSEFVKAYENGGVFLLDEMDAADPNVLLFINSALANGKVALPNRPDKPYAERHPDFICIAAANTLGTGADRQYSGRNKLDASTLDRFGIGKVILDYDTRVEKQLCPDADLLKELLRYRNGINAHRLERAMSTRFIKDAFTMKDQFGMTDEQVVERFFTGWREDEVNKVKSCRS